MGLADLTADGVEAALIEFDEIGRDAFLARYGFGPARSYFVWHHGQAYDSKAICGAAHGKLGYGSKPLKPSDFSGGDRTVAARLTKLGFEVIEQPLRMRVGGSDGELLKATCEVHRAGAQFVITLHSRGGTKGTASERNPDYFDALRILLSRLSRMRATLDAVLLDTDRTRHLPEAQRRLIPNAPLGLTPTTDTDSLVSAITKAAAAISTSTEPKKGGGNPTKQIQLRVSSDSLPTVSAVRSLIVLGSPRVFVLTWNPTVWGISEDELEQAIATTARGGVEQGSWATGNRKAGVSPGDHVVLFRQQSERGIIAHGIATSEIWQDEHFNDSSKSANYVSVLWTEWVSTDDRLPVEELQELSTKTDWNALMASGIQLPPEDAAAVLDAWGVDDTEETTPSRKPEDEQEDLPEGARKTVKVNRYERNPRARKRCLKAHGTACKVCSIDFGQAYSGIADGYIHVHHVVPIASIGKEYRLDPVKDLVPVCPNCHAMLHYGANPPRTVEELRSLLGL